MSNTYYLCGYYGMKNSGDDALLLATARGAANYLGAKNFAVNTPTRLSVPEFGGFPAMLRRQPKFRGENRLRQLSAALRCQHVIFGGGSVLHCKRDIQTKRLMMRLSGKGPHFALGVGVGPFATVAAEKQCAKFLNECAFVGLRDQASFDLAESIAPRAAIELTSDLAPLLADCVSTSSFTIEQENTTRRGIGVMLCPLESLQGDDMSEIHRVRLIARALTAAHEKTGEPIFLFDMNGHPELGDARLHDLLKRFLPQNIPAFHIPYDGNPLRVMQSLSKLRVVASMRLHGSVLAYLAKTPVISLHYHSKCKGWCEQVGLPIEYQFNVKAFGREKLTNTLVNGIFAGFQPPTLSIEEAKNKAESNFIFAQQCLAA